MCLKQAPQVSCRCTNYLVWRTEAHEDYGNVCYRMPLDPCFTKRVSLEAKGLKKCGQI
jgi:hypothetical protein